MNEVIETIHKQYIYQYEKYGDQPTRIILGVEVARKAFRQSPSEFVLSGKVTWEGMPVTIDYQNPRLIHVSIGEDYTVELEEHQFTDVNKMGKE